MADYVGQLGFIITLLNFYLCGLLFVIGAQINSFFFDHIRPLTSGLGTCISETFSPEQMPEMDDSFQSTNTVLDGVDIDEQ